MVLAKKDSHTSMEQKRKLRNKHSHLWSINPQQYTMKKSAASASSAGQLHVKE